jgi:hypothetical protein
MGHLQQQATAIAGLTVCGNTAAVGHAGQGLDGGLQQAMTHVTRRVCNQSKTAIVTEFFRSK